MAKAKNNGNGRLEEAMVKLIQSQASQLQLQTEFLARIADMDRVIAERFARIEQRFSTIESILLDHSRILADHGRILQALPEAVREKIGFKAPASPGSAH
jgi:hypothetical protein